ncbi:sensor histidine kinase [Actinotalea sp. M2MS4P-6]|uniref:sensor histidine kinase n=1 Tax=Actinotalea sp. M2MS4P-6 TaxID=2983762 RepID=UPI00398C5D45
MAFRRSEREQLTAEPAPPPELDDAAAGVLALLRSATVVLRRDGTVVRASAEAHSFGLLAGDRIAPGPVRTVVEDVVADGETRDAELELPRGRFGQATRLLQVRVAPLGQSLVLLLADDHTEARRVEQVRRDFVVNVSHELKTPIGAMSLLAETVEQAADDPEAVRRFSGRIQTEAARLSALVQEILELSRLQVSDTLTDAGPVSVDDVVAEAVDRARTGAVAKEIELDVGGDRGLRVWGVADLLVTALRNLLDNAVSYSEPGTRIGVGVTERGGAVEIAVVDQGIGIAADDLPRLFERFYRVDPARSRDTGGTGLGLSIVKHVVGDHGGDVSVWSEPGKGSTFTVRLPLVGEQPPEHVIDHLGAGRPAASAGPSNAAPTDGSTPDPTADPTAAPTGRTSARESHTTEGRTRR